MSTSTEVIEELANTEYKYGFVTDVEQDIVPKGLNEDVVRLISAKKGEPEWLLEWRLKAFRAWLKMTEPTLAERQVRADRLPGHQLLRGAEGEEEAQQHGRGRSGDPRDLRQARHPARSSSSCSPASPSTRCSIRCRWRRRSASKLAKLGIIFCSFSEAVREHPDLVKQYLGSVVPHTDNFFAALNSAVFSDGSFVYVPEGRALPDGAVDLLPHQRQGHRPVRADADRLRRRRDGQLPRRLHGAEARREPAARRGRRARRARRRDHQVLDRPELVSRRQEGKGGIYNFVTKRGICKGHRSKITWTQVETGSAITWKYPSCILQGDDSVGEFYSVAVTNNYQQADTGTKMIHLGKNTRSTIVSKGISAGRGQNTYRGAVKIGKNAANARNYSQCDSLLIGDRCGAHTFPYLEIKNTIGEVEHEASTSKIGEDQIFYCEQRGIAKEDAINMIVSGFCKEVFRELPMEFAVEAQKLLGISLEGSVG